MRVLAVVDSDDLMVQITSKELRQLAGFSCDDDFRSAIGPTSSVYGSYAVDNLKKLSEVKNIPVSDIYENAKETLRTYEELKKKFESIRNQLSNLLKKMALIKPESE